MEPTVRFRICCPAYCNTEMHSLKFSSVFGARYDRLARVTAEACIYTS